jgi:hypothetical protein
MGQQGGGGTEHDRRRCDASTPSSRTSAQLPIRSLVMLDLPCVLSAGYGAFRAREQYLGAASTAPRDRRSSDPEAALNVFSSGR